MRALLSEICVCAAIVLAVAACGGATETPDLLLPTAGIVPEAPWWTATPPATAPEPTARPTASDAPTPDATTTADAVANQTIEAGREATSDAFRAREVAAMTASAAETEVMLYCPDCADAGIDVNVWDVAGGMDAGANVIARFPHGTACTKLGQTGDYVKVRCPGAEGWLKESLVR